MKIMKDTQLIKYSLAVFEEGYIGIEDLDAATGKPPCLVSNGTSIESIPI